MHTERIAIYPGTFDPVTYGHLDIIKRASLLFDKVIMAVALNEKKSPIFSREERIALISENIQDIPRVEVQIFDGLTMHFAKKIGACAVIRGLRAISDFEFEFQMAQMNRHIEPSIETIFLMPSQEYFYTSSRIIKEIARYNTAEISKFVPKNVLEKLNIYFSKK